MLTRLLGERLMLRNAALVRTRANVTLAAPRSTAGSIIAGWCGGWWRDKMVCGGKVINKYKVGKHFDY